MEFQNKYLQQKKVVKASAELFWNEGRLRMTIPKAIRELIDGLNEEGKKCTAMLELCTDLDSFLVRAKEYSDAKIIPLYIGIVKSANKDSGGDKDEVS